MARLLGAHLLRTNLAHADEPLSPSAILDLHHTSIAGDWMCRTGRRILAWREFTC
jgi:hypothetical protein